MNLRQKLKRKKVIDERMKFFSMFFTMIPVIRKNGKTDPFKSVCKVIFNKEYKEFKQAKKDYIKFEKKYMRRLFSK